MFTLNFILKYVSVFTLLCVNEHEVCGIIGPNFFIARFLFVCYLRFQIQNHLFRDYRGAWEVSSV